MENPFQLRWLKGWTFQIVFVGSNVEIEAHGFGVCLNSPILPGESPQSAADNLVLKEDIRRKALHKVWNQNKKINHNPSINQAKRIQTELATVQ